MTTKSATDIDKQVGARIRARRMALQISQTGLAEAVGVTFQQIQKYEKGGNRVGSSRLAQIAEALEVPVAYFFEGLDGTTAAPNLLADPQIAKLLSAFTAIEDESLRQALVDMALAMGKPDTMSKDSRSRAGSSDQKPARSRKVRSSP